jgi:Methyltransferase FkbM domain
VTLPAFARSAKHAAKGLLPRGAKVRTIPFGIARGIRLEIDFHGGDVQQFLGLYEAELSGHLRSLAYRGARSFDVGGHIGYDALVLAKLTGGPVVTIECDEHLAGALRDNVARNPDLGPITIERGVVASTTTKDTIALDDLAARHFVPDLIKIDIEGAEAHALRGASHVLAVRRPGIVLEVHGEKAEWDCLELLRDAGYPPPTVVDPRRWLPEHRPLAHNRWLVLAGAPQ